MDKSHLLKEYNNLFSNIECSVTDFDYAGFEPRKKLLMQLSDVEKSSMALFDMSSKEYVFVRSKFDAHMNYPLNEIFKKEPRYFLELMPESDLKFVMDTLKQNFNFLSKTDAQKLKEYKLIFEFRLSDPAGNLYRFIQQCVVLEQDKNGNMWMILILNDLIPNRPNDLQLLRKVVHIPTNRICLFQDEEQSSKTFLTKRETEILGLISQGLQSKEISDSLFISVNTVNNHRQKIIEKLNAENTHEALNYAKTIGII